MSFLLFKRKFQLIIGKIGSKGVLFENLRFSFNIKMSDSKEKNTGTIKIYGISEETKGLIEEKDSSIIINISYGYENFSTLFIGNIVSFEEKKEGVEKFIEVEIIDGFIPLSKRKLSLSFNAGATTREIISKVSSELNLTKNDYSNITNLVYEQGFSFIGSPSNLLDKVLDRINYEWTITNNVLIITKNNYPSTETIMQFLSPETGLIEKPSRFFSKPVKKAKDKNKLIDGWKIKCLILTSLQPKLLINVESEEISGIFLIKNINFVGDTHSNNWFSEMEVIQKSL